MHSSKISIIHLSLLLHCVCIRAERDASWGLQRWLRLPCQEEQEEGALAHRREPLLAHSRHDGHHREIFHQLRVRQVRSLFQAWWHPRAAWWGLVEQLVRLMITESICSIASRLTTPLSWCSLEPICWFHWLYCCNKSVSHWRPVSFLCASTGLLCMGTCSPERLYLLQPGHLTFSWNTSSQRTR